MSDAAETTPEPFTYDVPAVPVGPAQCVHVRILVDAEAEVQGIWTHHDWWTKLIMESISGGPPVHGDRFYERLDSMEVPA